MFLLTSSDVLCCVTITMLWMFHASKTKSSSKENVHFFCFLSLWVNQSLNILSVAPDRVQNKINYGLNEKKIHCMKYPHHPDNEGNKQTQVESSRKALQCDDILRQIQ